MDLLIYSYIHVSHLLVNGFIYWSFDSSLMVQYVLWFMWDQLRRTSYIALHWHAGYHLPIGSFIHLCDGFIYLCFEFEVLVTFIHLLISWFIGCLFMVLSSFYPLMSSFPFVIFFLLYVTPSIAWMGIPSVAPLFFCSFDEWMTQPSNQPKRPQKISQSREGSVNQTNTESVSPFNAMTKTYPFPNGMLHQSSIFRLGIFQALDVSCFVSVIGKKQSGWQRSAS